MKSLTLNFANCIFEKDFANGLKEKSLLSTKMEKMCKKHIVNKINKNANFIDLPFQDKNEMKDIQLFGVKISRLFSRFVLVGDENVISGTEAVFSIKNSLKTFEDERKSEVDFEIFASENAQKLNFIFEKEDLNKTFFNFVLKDEFDIATLSLFSLTIAKLKEVMKEIFFVNIAVTTQEGNDLWNFCEKNKINTLKFPKDIDEKYCSLSPVGLFPMAVLGLDLEKVLKGAKQILENFKQENAEKSLSFATALIIHNFYKLKKRQVALRTLDSSLQNFLNHFQNILQKFDNISDEKVIMFLKFAKKKSNVKIPKLNEFISLPKSMQELNDMNYFALKQTLKEKGTPSFSLEIFDAADETIGQLLFYFELTSVIMEELFKPKINAEFKSLRNEKIKLLLSSKQKFKEKNNEDFKIKI